MCTPSLIITIYPLNPYTHSSSSANPPRVYLPPAQSSPPWPQRLAQDVNLSDTAFLVPYWHHKLNKGSISGYQASARGRVSKVRLNGNHIFRSHQAVTLLKRELTASDIHDAHTGDPA